MKEYFISEEKHFVTALPIVLRHPPACLYNWETKAASDSQEWDETPISISA